MQQLIDMLFAAAVLVLDWIVRHTVGHMEDLPEE